MNTINERTLLLIKSSESLHDGDLTTVGLQPKLDPVGIWTEGYGRAMIEPKNKLFLRGSGNKKRAYELISIRTEKDAANALLEDLKLYGKEVSNYAEKKKVILNDNQFGALTSFCYNLGGDPMRKTFDRVFKKGATPKDIQAAFSLYNKGKVNGELVILKGLVLRRKNEADLFLA